MLTAVRNSISKISDVINTISEKSYFTNVYGLGRSLIAFGTLLTLAFNSKYTLFYEPMFNDKVSEIDGLNSINLFLLFDYSLLEIPKIIAILILILVISGIFPRITGILHWWVSFSFLNSATLVEGGDQISTCITLFLVPITLLDKRKNHWDNSYKEKNHYINLIVYLLFILISLQISVLYLQSSIEKPYKVEEWMDGTALYYWFNNNIFGLNKLMRLIINPIFENKTLLFIINWGVIIFEMILFGAIFMEKKNRKRLLPFAILFHFLIAIIFGLVSFFFAMFGSLILYLYPKNENLNFKKYENYIRRKAKV
ncbi:sporulation-delaying protein SdpB family protein [uncultured Chryseobacterium sp.]|uniref:sporulation-delaying protein SdpB family protein n=1 Tax=uncultured Chryseobacterium sp. TaxID=259322 RepID=UPI0025CC7340|nr:sporulation-delaying protein SdpB family protein [uncultured Chryseobacterium sp.]